MTDATCQTVTTDPLLSVAITAYLGWPKAHTPTADRQAVFEVAKGAATDAARLLADVEGVIAASDGLPVADLTDQPDGGAAVYKGRLSGVRPDLSPDAIDALASRWFFHLRWLGIERGSDAPRYFVHYGGDGATPVPISLFRRRMAGGETVDEVLKDTDDWRPDRQSRIHNALTVPLDSDLEEVTGDEAGQFAEMVRSRRYVPFRTTRPATVLTRDGASVVALRFLSTPSETDGVERILLEEPVDAGSAWVFFQGRGYVERGDLDEMLVGNMPVVVPIDGRPPYALDPREDTDVQIERLREDGARRG